MHSPGVSLGVGPGAAPACAVGADGVASVGCLVDTTVGGVSGSVEVSSAVVSWLVSVVSAASANGAVSIAVVAAGVVIGGVGGVVRAGVGGVAVMSVSVVVVAGGDVSSDGGDSVAVVVAPFGFDFGGDFDSLNLAEGEESSGECEFHCVV